jgi:hypothetical protein
MSDGESRLADLARDLLGAKGLLEMVRELLGAMTPEAKVQLVCDMAMRSSYDLQRAFVELVTKDETLTKEIVAGVTARLREQIPTLEDELVKELLPRLKAKISETARRAIKDDRY